jgi:hypothetical protein
MKDYFFFSFGALFEKLSNWAFQKVSDGYLIFKEEELDREVEDRMFDLGMTKITIFHVNEGPIHRDSIPDDDGLPDDCEWLLEVKCRMNDDASVVDIPLWFSEFNEAFTIVNHFYSSVEPKVLYI